MVVTQVASQSPTVTWRNCLLTNNRIYIEIKKTPTYTSVYYELVSIYYLPDRLFLFSSGFRHGHHTTVKLIFRLKLQAIDRVAILMWSKLMNDR